MTHFFDDMLSCKQFADRVGVSDATIRAWVLAGALPCNRIGTSLVFHASQLPDAVKLRDREGVKARRNDLFRPVTVGQPGPADLVDLAQAGHVVGRTAMTVRRWVESGRLQGYRVAGRSSVSLAEVQAIAAGAGRESESAADPEGLTGAVWAEA